MGVIRALFHIACLDEDNCAYKGKVSMIAGKSAWNYDTVAYIWDEKWGLEQ